MRNGINAAQEMLCRPVDTGRAMKVAFALIAMSAGLAAANAVTAKSHPISRQIEAKSSLKPVILSIDWQEPDAPVTARLAANAVPSHPL